MSSISARKGRLSAVQKKAALDALLHHVEAPNPHHAALLDPTEDGSLRYVSRQEAIHRKLPVYTGSPDTLSKVFVLRGAPAHLAGFGSIRRTVNGLTDARIAAQKLISNAA